MALGTNLSITKHNPGHTALVGLTTRTAALILCTALAFASTTPITTIIAIAFLLGTTEVLLDTASETIVPAICERHNHQQANTTLHTTQLLAQDIGGRALAGLIAVASQAAAFAVSALGAAAALVAMAPLWQRFPTHLRDSAPISTGTWQLIRHQQPFLGRTLATTSLVVLALSSVLGTQVAYATCTLGANELTFAALMMAPSAGVVFAGMTPASWMKKIEPTARLGLALLMLAGLFCCIWLAGGNFVLVAVLYALSAYVILLHNVEVASLRKKFTPEADQGQITTLFRVVSLITSATGMLCGGVYAQGAVRQWGEATGYQSQYLLAAAGLTIAGALWLLWPQFCSAKPAGRITLSSK